MAGKVTVGLASHWPRVTDSVVYPPTGSMAYDREMSTPPTVQFGLYCIFRPYLTRKTALMGNIGSPIAGSFAR